MGKDYLGKDQRATRDDKEDDKPIQGMIQSSDLVRMKCFVMTKYLVFRQG